jgi:hypothetical protein
MLVLLCLMTSFFNLGVAWFAHVSLGSWSRLDARELGRLEPLVIPPTFVCFFAQLALLWTRPPGMPPFILVASTLLQIAIWALTLKWWSRYTRAMRSHWLRVVLVSAHAALMLWFVL